MGYHIFLIAYFVFFAVVMIGAVRFLVVESR